MITLKGIAAAPGINIAPAYKFGKEEFEIPMLPIKADDIPLQIQLFEESLIATRKEIIELQKRIAQEMGQEEAQIFDAHLLVLEDRMLIEEVISRLKKDQVSVPYIFSEVLKKYIQVFSKIEDEYLRERISDLNDVGKRVLRNLLGKEHRNLKDLKE
ncbi:MAG: phosphoenolpyruvate-utilizing N-terminal domain-containing protein, partial [Candidatus Omnitrophota bacterium]